MKARTDEGSEFTDTAFSGPPGLATNMCASLARLETEAVDCELEPAHVAPRSETLNRTQARRRFAHATKHVAVGCRGIRVGLHGIIPARSTHINCSLYSSSPSTRPTCPYEHHSLVTGHALLCSIVTACSLSRFCSDPPESNAFPVQSVLGLWLFAFDSGEEV
eukprot:848925-Rhodomonas_salina.2